MLVSDFIINYLASLGIKHVFLITGAAIAFTVDAFRKRRDITYICMNHEQAAAMAADAYSRVGPGLGVALATSGPGATNLITGICCSWFDSIPTLLITGQVNTKEQRGELKVRQLGFQETDIVEIVKPITKYAYKIENPQEIKYQLQKAVYIAKSQRPGPVLIDIPINIQYAKIPKAKLKSFDAKELKLKDKKINIEKIIKLTIDLINKSSRPVILAGFGNHLANSENELHRLVEKLNFPVVTTWSATDLFPKDFKLLVGQSGVYGSRAANFTIQNCDLLISVGARLDTRQTGGNPKAYARNAKKVVVDIDSAELTKGWIIPDVKVKSDAKIFVKELLSNANKIKAANLENWLAKIEIWKSKYPIVEKRYFSQKKFVNPYVFCQVLSTQLPADAIIIPDEGGNLTWVMQSIQIKSGQRLFSAFGNSPMGYALPASIGASFATGGKRPIICITGDGGLQLNIQEFQVIVNHQLPIKIFILNNKSYGIIKQFQDTWLGSRYEASQKGYSTPDFIKVAKAYGISAVQIKNHKELKQKIKEVLNFKGPIFCDVLLDPDQKISPKLEFGRPLEDLGPLLPREEFFKNMIIKPLTQSLKLKR